VSADETTIASVSKDRKCLIWDGAGCRQSTVSHFDFINCVSVSPDNTQVALGTGASGLVLKEIATNKQLHAPAVGDGTCCDVTAFSPDGKGLFAGSGRTLTFFRKPFLETRGSVTSGDSSFRFNKAEFGQCTGITEARVVRAEPAMADSDITNAEELKGAIALINRGAVPFGDKAERALACGAVGVIFSNHPDEELFVPSTGDNEAAEKAQIPVVLISHEDSETLKDGVLVTMDFPEAPPILKHHFSIRTTDFSPDGKLVATSCWDTVLKIWDSGTLKNLVALKHPSGIHAAFFSPNGKFIASASEDGRAYVFSVEAVLALTPPEPGAEDAEKPSGHDAMEHRLFEFGPHPGRCYSCCWYNSEHLVSSGAGGVKIWRLGQDEAVASFLTQAQVRGVRSFTTNGVRRIVCGDEAGSVYFLDFSPMPERAATNSHT